MTEPKLRKTILRMVLTLDGIAAGERGEQIAGVDYGDEDAWRDIFTTLDSVDALLLGAAAHKEYLEHWQAVLTDPNAKPNERRFAELAERTPHYVLSRSLGHLDFPNASVLAGGVAGIAALKAAAGGDILMWGGPTSAAAAIASDVFDEYHFETHPVIAGRGKKLFSAVDTMHRLRHLSTIACPSGVTIAKYARA